ncbi:uncharacterized protein IWZ02DRAFT_284511 [Phyllosticta citriasiana]|uniref:Uncharacterized protein n=1 Tax=Phyllosticta citriasiana TaxID=595635 RepID=A0ABR1KY76_9PEZI
MSSVAALRRNRSPIILHHPHTTSTSWPTIRDRLFLLHPLCPISPLAPSRPVEITAKRQDSQLNDSTICNRNLLVVWCNISLSCHLANPPVSAVPFPPVITGSIRRMRHVCILFGRRAAFQLEKFLAFHVRSICGAFPNPKWCKRGKRRVLLSAPSPSLNTKYMHTNGILRQALCPNAFVNPLRSPHPPPLLPALRQSNQ